MPLIPKGTLFVFEMSPRRTREEILAAKDRWIATYGA
jgi:hypothetical protein